MLTFNHFNFNVADLDKSLAFYKEALGLEPVRRKTASDGSLQPWAASALRILPWGSIL